MDVVLCERTLQTTSGERAVRVASIGRGVADALVPTGSDALLAETTEDLLLVAAGGLDPGAHVLQHLALDLGPAVGEIRVEHALDDILSHLLRRHAVVVPGLDDAEHSVLDNDLCNLTGRLIEDQGKVILPSALNDRATHLGEERVRRVGSVRVVEDFILVMRVDDSLRTSREGAGSVGEHGLEVRLERGETAVSVQRDMRRTQRR